MPETPKVLIPLAAGFEEVEAITVVDLLRRADIIVITASLTKELLVKGAHGIAVKADETLEHLKDRIFEAVVLPGGMPGATNLAENRELGELLKRHSEKGSFVAAICAAPMVLAKYGLLKDKRATSYPGFEEKLSGARIMNDPVVVDGRIVTSRGPGTAMQFSLKLIELLRGQAQATQTQAALLFS